MSDRFGTFSLDIFPDSFAICRLEPDTPIPEWAHGDFLSITRTQEEHSIVCPQDRVPDAVRSEKDWRCLRVAGKLDFSLVGVIASLTGPLADAGIGVFVVSSFDRDFLLVRDADLGRAVEVLEGAGHRIAGEP